MSGPTPLRERRTDLVFVVFFLFNLIFITYMVDLEQLVVANVHHFSYPAWPPRPLIDLVHWYGNHYDPLLMARPPFWRMTIWIDVIFFGPFYLAAGYAFIRGHGWIRVPALVWSGTMLANVLILMMEERYGQWASPHFPMVLGANLTWLLLPFAVIWRMRHDRPFERPARSGRRPAGPDRSGTEESRGRESGRDATSSAGGDITDAGTDEASTVEAGA